MRFGVNRNFYLRNQDFVADGAVAALGLAGRVAGRRHSGVRHRRMLAGCRNLFHAVENFAADRASHALGVAGFRAGGSFRFYNFFGMLAGSRNGFHLLIAADLAGLGNRAVRHTGRFHRDRLIIMRNFAVRNLHHIAIRSAADRADQADLRVLRAGGVYQALHKVMLTSGRDDFVLGFLASRASIQYLSIFAAGSRLICFGILPLVTGRNRNIVVIRRILRIGILHDSVGRAGGGFDYRYGICSLILINRNGAAAGTDDSHTIGNLACLDGASLHFNGSSRSSILNQIRQRIRGTNIVLGAAGVRHGNGAAVLFHVILHTGTEGAAGDIEFIVDTSHATAKTSTVNRHSNIL